MLCYVIERSSDSATHMRSMLCYVMLCYVMLCYVFERSRDSATHMMRLHEFVVYTVEWCCEAHGDSTNPPSAEDSTTKLCYVCSVM